ncbi:MAG: hypothetical protein JKY87_00160 [Mariprofundus sp.]|nr:hypothetical protein [Mariprofundus sp.]
MSVSQRIRDDYGTVIRFAKLHGLNPQSLYTSLAGRPEYTSVVNVLIEKGYIQSADELRKVA